MQYRRMGRSGLKLSEVAVGSWMTDLKGREACDTAKEVLRRAYNSGVNFFDCADAYSGGQAGGFPGKYSERISEKFLRGFQQGVFPSGRRSQRPGAFRKHIVEQLNRSLKNLQVDYLDLYFCHRFDPETCMEETLETLSDMVAQGKILYYGVSEWSPVQITKALGLIQKHGYRPLSVIPASVQYGGPVY